MNIILDTNRFSVSNVFFLDKKKNIIIDGDFTKIIYSNHYFTMSCMYFQFSLEPSKIDNILNKTMVYFQPYGRKNATHIQDISKIEYRIIECYKKANNLHKQLSNILSKQLYTGVIKLFDCSNISNEYSEISIIVKISGIWETENDIGISYKLYN